MSLLFLRTTVSKLRRKIYDISVKYASNSSTFRVFLKKGLANHNGYNWCIEEWEWERERERKHRKFTGRPHAMIATCMRRTEMVRVERERDTLGRRTCETHYASWWRSEIDRLWPRRMVNPESRIPAAIRRPLECRIAPPFPTTLSWQIIQGTSVKPFQRPHVCLRVIYNRVPRRYVSIGDAKANLK